MSLCLNDVTIHNRDGQPLFPPLTLTLQPGAISSLMGPSGCGKSTLLNLIAGHLSDDFSYQGTVVLNGVVLDNQPAHLRQVGILFQDDLLFPHLNIWENIAFALPNDLRGRQRQVTAMAALEEINLGQIAHAMPEQISGGQRARVSLIRALLAKPQVILLDEPFSKLDQSLRGQFRDWVFEKIAQADIPALMVTHDPSDVPAESLCLSWPWSN